MNTTQEPMTQAPKSVYKQCLDLLDKYYAKKITKKEMNTELEKLADKQVEFNFKGGEDG